MNGFSAPLDVRKIVIREPKRFLLFKYKNTKDCWEVLTDFTYTTTEGDLIHVRKGTRTDFASTPLGVRNLFPKDGAYAQAAVLHDDMYKRLLFSQEKCDRIFLEAMKYLGVPLWKRRVMYRALRMFGWISYNKNKKK